MEENMKQITKFKRLLSGVLSAVMTVSAVPIVSAHADESTEPYPYTISDVTGGKYYYASTSGDLESIYLKFGEDIESSDENDDGLDDYYE